MKEGGRRGGLGESGGQGVLSSLPPRWVSFHPVKQPRSVGRGGARGQDRRVRCEWGGTAHTVAFTAGLKRPPPSKRSGHAVPVPTGGGKEGEAGLRDSGQLCHLVGRRGGGCALFCAAGSGDSRGAGRGDPLSLPAPPCMWP